MTDYRVVYVRVAVDDDRDETATRIERECDHAAREGWYLHSVIDDIRNSSTAGIWLVFAAADDEGEAAPAIAVAEEILTQSADNGGGTSHA
jgi:hypothetical protein